MSLRNVRKIYGENVLPAPQGSSDEEFEPLYAKQTTGTNSIYQAFQLSSQSESDHGLNDDEENAAKIKPKEVVKKKKKKRGKKMKQLPKADVKNDMEEIDEVEKSVKEVNAILGAPPTAIETSKGASTSDQNRLMDVQQKHLNVDNEMKRMFGRESVDQANRRRGRQTNYNRHFNKPVIVTMTDYVGRLQKLGLSMSVHHKENVLTYFAFDHDKEYQKLHKLFLSKGELAIMRALEDNRFNHIEALLENAHILQRIENYEAGNTLIQHAIAHMQNVAHPSFNLTDRNVRLEYRIMENRSFHIAVLNYLHVLTNRACHRTALELAKLLLNLDPSDPLAVLLIIDTLALRAREHQWLIDAVDYWSQERQAGFLFNIQYSYAMAHFHVATKNKGDLSKADQLLQEAMLRFPSVPMKLFECASVTPNARLQAHPLFNSVSETSTGKHLAELIFLYAKFTWPKWREGSVFDWLTRNAIELVDKYDNDVQIQNRVKELTNERLNLFQTRPEQVARHFSVIGPLSSLLVDGAVPTVETPFRGFNPFPPAHGINRYEYGVRVNPPANRSQHGYSALYEFFASVVPMRDAVEPLDAEIVRLIIDEENDVNRLQARVLQENQIVDTSDSENEDVPNADGGRNLLPSVGQLTAAVRRLLDMFENHAAQDQLNNDNQNQGGINEDQQDAQNQPQDGANEDTQNSN